MTTPHPYQEAIDLLEDLAKKRLNDAIADFQEGLMRVNEVEAYIEQALSILIGPPPSPSITVDPATGAPDTRVTVHGFNFTPDARVFVRAAALHMFTSTIRADGEFHGEFTLPSFIGVSISINIVYELDVATVIASAPFLVTEAPPTPPPPAVLVDNLRVSTGKGVLDSAGLGAGRLLYTDRTFVFSTPIPPEVAGGVLIRLANEKDDANNSSANYLRFDVHAPVNVYVLYDKREPKDDLPMWLQDASWVDTGLEVRTTDTRGPLRWVFKKSFPAGTVTLGGGGADPNSFVGSNYNVVIKAA